MNHRVQRVGVIGGGQLAWMMGDAARKLGLELVVQTPSQRDPAVSIATDTILAPVDDVAATAQLAHKCDIITFENEFVDLQGLKMLAQQGVRFAPSLDSLTPLLDKYDQRSYLQSIGLPTPRFAAIDPFKNTAALEQFEFPVVLKARRHGYDGQGTFILKEKSELTATIAAMQQARSSTWLIEEFVPFERELAIMVARSVSGEIAVYPIVETQQQDQVCRRVLVTEEWGTAVTEAVATIARTLVEKLQVVGIFGIELFLKADGDVLVNEIAPRTHNSGHYTLDACVTSQFEQQLRAVSDLPLGDVALRSAGAVMVNLLGYESSDDQYLEKRQQLGNIPHAHVYWYGKAASRPGRKLGHVTVSLNERDAAARRSQALALAETIEKIWYP